MLQIGWDSVVGVPQTLKAFANGPVAFILGALLSVFLGGLDAIVTAFLEAILAVYDAIAYVPTTAAGIIEDTGGAAGGTLLDALDGVFAAFEGAVSLAGPGAPLLVGVLVAGTVVVGAYAVQFLWTLAVDSINPL